MRRSARVLGILCTVGALWGAEVQGQQAPLASFGVQAGAIAPQTTLPDGSSHASGAAVGASGMVWPLRYLGARLSVAYGKTAGVHGEEFSAAAAHDPKVWLYSAEVAVRYPFEGGGVVWFPYLSAGPGGKSYRWAIDRPRIGDSALALTYGGGVDIRPRGLRGVGVVVDVRNYRSRYMWHGLGVRATVPDYEAHGPMLNDLLVTAGITISR